MRFDDQRKRMVETNLIPRGILDQKVIEAFLKVPRERFVSAQWKEFSYQDHPLSIGFKQTISQPYIVALMMSLIEIKETDKVLEIGTGCGYQTALLAEIAEEVFTIERIEELLISAKKTLKNLEYTNIHFKIGDGCLGWVNTLPPVSEFDKIIVSAASPDLPKALLSQLKINGKMIVPQGSSSRQELIVYEKLENEVLTHYHGGCVFVPLIGEGAWDN
ncbi:MAG: protein-L-isoaspartate(D-aspartate) O-methyltransferase [Candidatus Cloacimonetes bacterium]|nr:protein-L-isoaspartate(D-aspartate) O-methyltransferase [Candidatus Cloacimonadota bacterium]